MHMHSVDSVTCVDDWEARARISEVLEQLVDEAARDADMGRHSTGTIDYGAELEALTGWFGIE